MERIPMTFDYGGDEFEPRHHIWLNSVTIHVMGTVRYDSFLRIYSSIKIT